MSPIVTVAEVSRTGLSEVEAARQLEARGEVRRRRWLRRSYASILRANTVTIPNGILLLFGVLTITFGSWRDPLFLGILVAETSRSGPSRRFAPSGLWIGWRRWWRPRLWWCGMGWRRVLPVDPVVVGDLVRLAAGDQVVADGMVVSADGLAVDEANLTGESESVVRGREDPVWSG